MRIAVNQPTEVNRYLKGDPSPVAEPTGDRPPIDYQYGPAWVAEHYGGRPWRLDVFGPKGVPYSILRFNTREERDALVNERQTATDAKGVPLWKDFTYVKSTDMDGVWVDPVILLNPDSYVTRAGRVQPVPPVTEKKIA